MRVYKITDEQKKVFAQIANNLQYLWVSFQDRGGSIREFCLELDRHTDRVIDPRYIYNTMQKDSKKQSFRSDWYIWVAASRHANISLETLMFYDLQMLDEMQGIER